MNRLATTALTLLLAAASMGASAASVANSQLTGCAAKRESIRSELQQAQAQGLSDKVAGLTRALDEVNAHCRDNVLVERHNKKVLKAQAKVNQTERSLRLAQEAGFVLDKTSEINANPADDRDHPFGVWTLPPVRLSAPRGEPADPNFDRAPYDAIGESDRMTLRLVKPAA